MTATQRSSRLPVTPQDGGRGGDVVRGLVALVATLALVIGIPVALASAFGAPWPSQVPDLAWVTQPLTTDVLMHVLAAVVWLAWLHFVVCLVAEAVSEIGARGLAPRIPGGGIGTQALARKLVTTIVLLVGTASIAAPAATAAVPAPEHRPVGIERVVGSAERSVEAQTTQQATKVADAERPAVSELSRATRAEQRGGDLTTYYDVKPPNNRNYDTLWDIAERYLGDGFRYKEIYAMNRNVVQPDGRTLSNPDLIHPGWVMKMPNDARGPGLKVVEAARDDLASPSSNTGTPGAAGSSAADDAAVSGGESGGAEVGGGVGGVVEARAASSSSIGEWAPVFGVAGGLALAGALVGLRRRRASNPGGGPDRPKGSSAKSSSQIDVAARVEAGLRDEAAPADAEWLAGAVRGLHATALPPLARAALSSDGLVAAFRSEPSTALPDGWASTSDARTWMLPREAATMSGALSPLPALVCAGTRDDGAVLLLDLESYDGVVSLGGDPVVARGVAMSLAVETATHPWADSPVVTLVGFADDVSAIGNVEAVSDIGRALDALDNVAHDHRAACRAYAVDSVPQLRQVSDDPGRVRLQLVVCSGVPDPAALARLHAWAADPMVAVAVVVVGDCPDAAARLTATEDGRLVSAPHAIDVLAQELSPEACRGLADLFTLPTEPASMSIEELAEALVVEEAVLATGDDEPVVVSVDLLGPVVVRAPGPIDEARRDLFTEIVAYLAVHPDGVHVNVLTAAIWPRGVDPETRDATMSAVAEWVGTTGAGEPVLTSDAGVWALRRSAVACDWDRFRAALNRAVTSRARVPALRTAMSLVRGTAFTGVPQGRYAWLAHLGVEEDVALAVEMTSAALATECTAVDDANGARDALLAGLAALPASETLWCAAMRLAVRFSGRADATVVADQMYAAIAAHGSPLGATSRTHALVEELLPGYRRGVA
ncbi:LysM peptidoglycan-binding domain-containing protein [Mumia zhuanghuii]|uniref:LysM peptidoglycan-binding domain-containing protein n=2 Tax=Mumia TaxID=1546255 RepID=A0ABW1QJJ7_9ACTN|nr:MULTISPECIES: LysM peptidoglycan-binding domain-containing protein [Mumia]KAA1419957.1 LysM peptidoglycan-binding domain-containing protein [Mumia zhuanghuii]